MAKACVPVQSGLPTGSPKRQKKLLELCITLSGKVLTNRRSSLILRVRNHVTTSWFERHRNIVLLSSYHPFGIG